MTTMSSYATREWQRTGSDAWRMELKEINDSEYSSLFPAVHVYNSTAFAQLNAMKVDAVRYLAFADGKLRFGIMLGECDKMLRSPFSAPFGGFAQRGVQSLNKMEEAVQLLQHYAAVRSMGIAITLPPLLYDEGQLSKWVSVFLRAGFKAIVDLNYHFRLSRFAAYRNVIDRSARNHLNRSLKANFRLLQMRSDCRDEVARAYEVIRRNRKERGYPLRMTLEQVWQTVNSVVSADFFVLEHDGNDVAAAQVFHVAPGIAQVIYWGDIRCYSELRPMNYLTYAVFSHYHAVGLQVLDIGPSTEDGIPNYGLCDFKEDIGCEVTLKYRFEKTSADAEIRL